MQGLEPQAGLRHRQQQMLALGMNGMLADLMAWELHRLAPEAQARLAPAEALLAAFRRTRSNDARHVPLLLDLAEARADVRAPGSCELALEAAHLLRRGSTYLTVYLPEGLVRCARLLPRQ